LTGNPLEDFSKKGAGWSSGYKAGAMYGTGGSAGAPSVDYGGINPYYVPEGTRNNTWMVTDNGNYYYRDYSGVIYGPYTSNDLSLPLSEGAITSQPINPSGTGQKTKKQVALEEEAARSQERAEYLRTASFNYPDTGKGAGVGQAGEIVSMGKETYIRQEDGTLKLLYSAASGGFLKSSGVINAHAGEVIGPLSAIAPMISQATNNTTTTSSNNISINISINGNADKDVTDDMIRKIKRELFGRGVTV